jgi:tRNA dimethylallyltransferase
LTPGLRPAVPVLVGPTASGKTECAVRAAEFARCEVVSADSRQVYRFMDIGTAKPTADEQRRVRHHCIDVVDPGEPFNAGRYAELSRSAVRDILARGAVPLVVGGSGLYVRALVDGLIEGDFRDEAVRARLNQEAAEQGTEAMHRRLGEEDPEAAERIHPNDLKRIVRALEILLVSGVPMTRLHRAGVPRPDFDPVFFGLRWDKNALAGRIETRVDRMIAGGLADEVRRLFASGVRPEANAMQSVGYREMIECLDGRIGIEEAADRIKRNTRRFAKRQMTWFRGEPRIRWIDIADPEDLVLAAQTMVQELERTSSSSGRGPF